MDGTLSPKRTFVIVGVPMLITGLIIALVNSPYYNEDPERLSGGIVFDLLVTSPLLYYLLIRKTSIPKTTVAAMVIFGLVVSSIVLPSENQFYLDQFKTWGMPLLEISVLAFVVYKVRKAVSRNKDKKDPTLDFFSTLKTTCKDLLPGALVMPVVLEISVFYYGFISWRKRVLRKNEFSYHRESGTVSLLLAILFLVIIETAVFHMLLARWSHTAAWVLTALSIYSGIQIFGFLKSLLKRPLIIENGRLYLRYGIMSETTIDLKEIDAIELSSADLPLDGNTRKLSILGPLEGHNTLIHLKSKNVVLGLYGRKREYRSLALHIDDRELFKSTLEGLLQSLSIDKGV